MERVAELQVDAELLTFVADELLPGTGISSDSFWSGASSIVHELSPVIRGLLDRRDDLQRQLDGWHRAHPGPIADAVAYEQFLRSIGYLVDEPADFEISTENVDTEIASQAGPQLVVPLTNARFAANAANARWGSLYDALYGTDAIARTGDLAPTDGYNPARGSAVMAAGRELLDVVAPLSSGSHAHSTRYALGASGLEVTLADGTVVALADPAAVAGYRGEPANPTGVLLVHNGLHLEIAIDRDDPVGGTDAAGVRDLILESAVTAIMDLEDSIAAVDAEDKIVAYRNWLLLMQGRLAVDVTKNGTTFTRELEPDREYSRPDGSPFILPGRSQLFVRHVGHFMQTDAVLDRDGEPVPEGILDALVTALAALPSLRGEAQLANSRTGSIYVVKPKLHGPEEVAATVRLFAAVERLLELPERTIKIGIMDEERRTTLNLKASIHEARDRVVFINTGFLDRTGDEIHTSMLAGPVLRKSDLRTHPYIGAYENQNVDVGLAAGFSGHAQIGKGMWAMPDLMAAMVEQKIAQPRAGATTAWVPSPTAATLHATHYHRVDVAAVQAQLRNRVHRGIAPILDVPVAAEPTWTAQERRAELDNNVQSILGYVVRWVDQGIGCSKVLDLDDVGLMEDRATLRISSQLLGNWLLHGVITREEVQASLERLSSTVDRQNADDPAYLPLLSGDSPSLAFRAARDLILEATAQPNGYTEPILHSYRRLRKAQTR